MQSSVSIGLKVKTHRPVANLNTYTHTHALLAKPVLHGHTYTHKHTLMLGRQAVVITSRHTQATGRDQSTPTEQQGRGNMGV